MGVRAVYRKFMQCFAETGFCVILHPVIDPSEPDMNHMPPQMMDTLEVLRVKLTTLKQAHRDLDAKIDALQEAGSVDQLLLRRLKKQKLALKDQIASLADRTTPDIIA